MKPVCLVFGAGAGIGGTVAAKFAEEGYHSFLCRRSDKEGLDKLIGDIEASGGSASGQLLNAIEDDAIEEVINKVESEVGPIEVVIYNLGAQTGMKLLSQTTYKEFEWVWKMASFGLFRVAKMLCPLMVERGKGTILVTSATAAMRGNAIGTIDAVFGLLSLYNFIPKIISVAKKRIMIDPATAKEFISTPRSCKIIFPT